VPSAPIYTASSSAQILRIFFGFYGNETRQFGAPPPGTMAWPFLFDGTVDEVDLQTPQTTTLKSNGPIWEPISPPSPALSIVYILYCLYFDRAISTDPRQSDHLPAASLARPKPIATTFFAIFREQENG
jgi:hypothetical protein